MRTDLAQRSQTLQHERSVLRGRIALGLGRRAEHERRIAEIDAELAEIRREHERDSR